MLAKIKRVVLATALVAALLVAFAGGFVKAPAPAFRNAVTVGHQLVWYCPAPPVEC